MTGIGSFFFILPEKKILLPESQAKWIPWSPKNLRKNFDMKNTFLIIAFIIALVGISLYITVSNWNECRDFGHSILYCLKMISR
jgi:hypothetical protein